MPQFVKGILQVGKDFKAEARYGIMQHEEDIVGLEFLCFDAGLLEDFDEANGDIHLIRVWILLIHFKNDDTNGEAQQSSQEDSAEKKPKDDEATVVEPSVETSTVPTPSNIDNEKSAGNSNNGGDYGGIAFNRSDFGNATKLWIMKGTTIKGPDFSRNGRQGTQNPKSNGVTDGIGPIRAAFTTPKVQSTTGSTNFGNTNNYDSVYNIILLVAVCVVLTVTILVFIFSWSAWNRKARAAAEVEYPAYGVTGPSDVESGDRRLAHSAQMFHYHHQKQQIIAMTHRRKMETRVGSVSDPESEDDNEVGDYTVYECPGLATTGDMEVQNPMFTDEPTPCHSGVGRRKRQE